MHQRPTRPIARPVAARLLQLWVLAASVALAVPGVASTSQSDSFQRGACTALPAKTRLRGLGAGWVVLREEMIRGAAPDFRVQTMRWSLLRSDGTARTLDLPMTKLLSQLPASLLGIEVSKRNSAGQIFDNVTISSSAQGNIELNERGEELALILRVTAPTGTRAGRKLAAVWRVAEGSFVVAKAPLVEAGDDGRDGFVAGTDALGRWIFVAAESLPVANGRRALRYHLRRLDPASATLTPVGSSAAVEREGATAQTSASCAFSPDRRTLACAEYQEDPALMSGIHVFDLESGAARVLAAPATTYVLAFDPSGKRLALGSNRTADVWVYDLASGKRVLQGKGPASMHQGAWLPDGRLLLHGDGAPRLLDDQTLKDVGDLSLTEAFGKASKGGFLARSVRWRDVDRVGLPVVRSNEATGFGDPVQICWLRPAAAAPTDAPARASAPAARGADAATP